MGFLPIFAGVLQGQQNYQDAIQQRQMRAQQMAFEQARQQALQTEMQRQAAQDARDKQVAQGTLALYGNQGSPQPPMPGQPSQPMRQPWQPMDTSVGGPPKPPIPPYRSMSQAQQPSVSGAIPEPPKYDWETAVKKVQAQGITDPQAIVAILDKQQVRLDTEAKQRLAQAKESIAEQVALGNLAIREKNSESTATRAEKARDWSKQPPVRGGAGGGAATGGMGALTKDAIDVAAHQMIATGVMPPMGMGKAAAAQRAAVLNRAAEIMKEQGDDAGDLAGNKADVKAQGAALTQLQKLDGMIGNFEQTASKNAELALKLAKKGMGGTGSPTINAWIQSARVGVGSGDVIAFRNALTTFKTEYAKILSGATGAAGITDAARREADTLLSENMSADQLEQAIATAKAEMGNRRSSIKEQIEQTRKGIRAVGKGSKDAHPADISDLLKKYGN